MIDIDTLSREVPILIAGPTASGKSALALEIAERQGGRIVNADALQVYDGWRILTARPSPEDEARATHALYGHVPFTGDYSTGVWLRDVRPLLTGGLRPIILGGTGLNFAALTGGLADIPETPPEIRAEAEALPLAQMLADLDRGDPVIAARIDRANPMRVQRAWEVLRATGRPLSDWQADTPAPDLPLAACQALVLDAPRDWLNARIARRFDQMLQQGALDEARAILPLWDKAHGARKAIGGPELIAHLKGEMTLEAAREAAITASRQYAKRQRTWFRARMADWRRIPADQG
ncbi:tRNA (adenosine(37)-N6)-dimethylallyltransferase MiaA [Alterinioella nitratireducens]|uniref:tRNA (adenosine(37)-N6)-dimethylallyltransferase MiaA n=1 Tax=Alterinioella nitratireducens TaxID=2735915 RepID=UPI00155252AE|nr:tRNA (adenosine(37)-N6)-dimethylallyltransferase MiaA [Alterinioella nitratireducens]NPD19111.1 tRNA (adenosine(37)-N6)-dimethylallyltransferase MiaA [Alterinioella nitratireducens]